MTIPERGRVVLTESLADLDPELLTEILARLDQVPGDRDGETYIREMRTVVVSVVEHWLAASKARTQELKRANAIAEQMKNLTTSGTIH